MIRWTCRPSSPSFGISSPETSLPQILRDVDFGFGFGFGGSDRA